MTERNSAEQLVTPSQNFNSGSGIGPDKPRSLIGKTVPFAISLWYKPRVSRVLSQLHLEDSPDETTCTPARSVGDLVSLLNQLRAKNQNPLRLNLPVTPSREHWPVIAQECNGETVIAHTGQSSQLFLSPPAEMLSLLQQLREVV